MIISPSKKKSSPPREPLPRLDPGTALLFHEVRISCILDEHDACFSSCKDLPPGVVGLVLGTMIENSRYPDDHLRYFLVLTQFGVVWVPISRGMPDVDVL